MPTARSWQAARETPIAWLLGLAWREARLPLLFSAGEKVLRALVPLGQALAVGGLVAGLSTSDPSWQQAWPWALLLLASYLALQGFLLMSFKEHLYQVALQRALDEPVLRKLTHLELSAFEDPAVRDLIARVGEPSGRAKDLCEDLLYMIGNWLQITVLAVYLGWTVWWLGPVLIAGSAQLARFDAALGRRFRALEQEISLWQREAGYASDLLVSRGSVREVRLFGLSDHLIDRWSTWFAHVHRARARFDLGMIGPIALRSNAPRAVRVFGAMIALGWGLQRRGADPAAFAASLSALLSLVNAARDISWSARNLGQGAAYFAEVRQLLALPEPPPGGSRPFPTPMREGIRFEGVTFAYPRSDRPVLQDVSFHIRPRERIALVGPNGAGKSTLVKLLLGLYRPDAGRITVDGVDLRDIDPASRRQAMSAIFQDFAQFSLKARENIGLGQLDRIDDRDAIRAAALQGGAAEWIERLGLQYETPLGQLVEGSHEPSGGQWQKLALSRGLMRQAPLLILDEPTAALDPLAEVAVYRHFAELLHDRTAVLVTHRLGSARIADRIVVLEGGRIVETGHHQELVQAHGPYSRMFAAQAAWYQEGVAS